MQEFSADVKEKVSQLNKSSLYFYDLEEQKTVDQIFDAIALAKIKKETALCVVRKQL